MSVADRVYVAQVASLFSSIKSATLMAMIFIIDVWAAYEVTADQRLVGLGAAGSILMSGGSHPRSRAGGLLQNVRLVVSRLLDSRCTSQRPACHCLRNQQPASS